MLFTSVQYKPLGNTVAQVNRITGDLFINPSIWPQLPTEVKEFVMYHEDGHLRLQTPDEYEANKYAVGKFMQAGTLNDEEFGRRIVVLSEILGDKGRETYFKDAPEVSNMGIDPISNIAGAIGDLFKVIPVLFGSKKRIAEADNYTENQLKILDAQGDLMDKSNQSTQTILIVGGMFLVVLLVLFLTLNSK